LAAIAGRTAWLRRLAAYAGEPASALGGQPGPRFRRRPVALDSSGHAYVGLDHDVEVGSAKAWWARNLDLATAAAETSRVTGGLAESAIATQCLFKPSHSKLRPLRFWKPAGRSLLLPSKGRNRCGGPCCATTAPSLLHCRRRERVLGGRQEAAWPPMSRVLVDVQRGTSRRPELVTLPFGAFGSPPSVPGLR
jgi:hypothetical protein